MNSIISMSPQLATAMVAGSTNSNGRRPMEARARSASLSHAPPPVCRAFVQSRPVGRHLRRSARRGVSSHIGEGRTNLIHLKAQCTGRARNVTNIRCGAQKSDTGST
jgi:hypothetical protein